MTVRSLSFIDALQAGGPASDRAENMELYGFLVGAWDLDVTEFEADGSTRRCPGEWHFGWVLEGRAIQDVWIVPSRGAGSHADTANSNRYGTTLRVYDPRIDAWHIQWTEPVTQAYLRRWSFSEITPASFRWRGEVSAAEGATWHLHMDFIAHRSGTA